MDTPQRWFLFWLWAVSSFCVLGALVGCSAVTPSVSTLSAPVFLPTSEDAPRLAMLTHELDRKALQCVEAATCEHVYFSRAMVSLFENREAARASFHHVIEHNPASPLASSSQLWLRLIANQEAAVTAHSEGVNPMTDLVAQLVREWMERQVSEGQNTQTSAASIIQAQPVGQPRVLQGLQKQVRERDHQIAVLRAQLEALKSIDQDHADKQRKIKPPESLRMAEPYAP